MNKDKKNRLDVRVLRRFTKTKVYNYLPDRIAVSIKYYNHFLKRLNLKHPVTFNEKLQWLKLYDRHPEYTDMVDKCKAKEYVARVIGKEYIIPTLGKWKSFDDIDFDSLPDQFVLKCNHGSGDVVICKNKSDFDMKKAREILTNALNTDYYLISREWPYKNVERFILAEKYIEDKITHDARDYKFFCFDGVAESVMVCIERETGNPIFYFFDKDWKLKDYNKKGKEAPDGFSLPKPECIDKMFLIAEKLSQGIPYVRVDLYCIDGCIYFGEITFYPASGLDEEILPETDVYWGEMLHLPEKKRIK